MTATCILGIDPGVSTGIAIANQIGGKWRFTSLTLTTIEEVYSLVAPPIQVVVVEKFDAQLISKYGLHTVRVIGGVYALAWKYNIEVVTDTPQQRKPYLPYARKLVADTPHHNRTDLRHEIDAMAHVVRLLYKSGHISTIAVEEP
jgi:hypothetical protein